MKTLNLNSEDLLTAASMLKVLGHPIQFQLLIIDDASKMSVTDF